MDNTMRIFVGIILLVFGAILAYLSILLRLIDIILFLGILLVLVGAVLFVLGLLASSYGRKISFSKNVVDIVDAASNDLKNQHIASNIKDSVLGSNGISSNGIKRARSNEQPLLKPYGGKYQNDSASLLGPTRKSNKKDNRFQSSSADLRRSNNRNSNKFGSMSSNRPTNKSNHSILGGFKSKEPANPKAVFNIPNSSAPKEKTYEYSNPFRSKSRTPHSKHEILVVNDESNKVPALRDLNFTPNYDRPMRVTRRPRRKSEDTINLNNVPKRTLEGSRLIFEDNSYLELEKEPSFPKPKSFRTFEDVADDVIVPIHVDDINNIAEEGLDSNYVNVSYAGYDNNSNSLEYDYSNSMQEPVHIVEVTQKPVIKEQVIQEIEPDTTPVTIPGTTLEDQLHANDFGFNAPDDEFVIDDGDYEDDYIIVEHGNDDVTDVPYDEEFIIDNLEDLPDDEENSKPLVAKPVETINPDSLINSTLDDFKDDQIKFNPKKPETLPIPKLLNSYVICEKGMLTSLDAFEEVATHAKSELLLEAPDIRDMGEVFLSALTKVNSKVIIQEFDKEDLSYVLLISSLIKSGVQIRTAPVIGSFNLIGDLSHALIISNDDSEDMEYGAVYDDEDSVKDIKKLFEASWNLAKDLDI